MLDCNVLSAIFMIIVDLMILLDLLFLLLTNVTGTLGLRRGGGVAGRLC